MTPPKKKKGRTNTPEINGEGKLGQESFGCGTHGPLKGGNNSLEKRGIPRGKREIGDRKSTKMENSSAKCERRASRGFLASSEGDSRQGREK